MKFNQRRADEGQSTPAWRKILNPLWDPVLTDTRLLLLTGLYLSPAASTKPLFAEPISGRSTNSVNLTAVNSFPPFQLFVPYWTGGLIIGQRLTWGWGTNQSPWQSSSCFPLELLRLTGDQCWRPALKKVASVLLPCLCVRQVTGPSQRVTQREECCVPWNIFLKPVSNGK